MVFGGGSEFQSRGQGTVKGRESAGGRYSELCLLGTYIIYIYNRLENSLQCVQPELITIYLSM